MRPGAHPSAPHTLDALLACASAPGTRWLFHSYYKYAFTFRTPYETPDGPSLELRATAGGDAADVYRFAVQDPMAWDEIRGAGVTQLSLWDGDTPLGAFDL